jgi:hypothetical protein
MEMRVNTDIDIDVYDRDEVLKFFNHIPASIVGDNKVKKHNSGV